ncbi:IPT/TIG domain-containing protein [Natronincola ferrireducens]|uniref:IPT/TIG domain-containing protein n=1 Tax=Natronincola ferrireducens TaxID=393762 RepID=A0A1G8X0Z5_9FIRM|nr:IPT/TIG domain-containing protein [Natronincola ferrireducens]SDJ84203.1 IPT/TIG domain-containing protein [Natronincola ferrireducens]
MKKKKKMRRIIAFLMTLMMVFIMLPIEDMEVHGFDPDRYRVDEVILFRVYDRNRNVVERRLLIYGAFLKDAEVGVESSSGYNALTNRITNSEGILQFNITNNQLGSSIRIEGKHISLKEEDMPTLTGITRKVKIGEVDGLNIQGTNLTKIKDDDNIVAKYEHEGAETTIASSVFDNDTNVNITPATGQLGMQNIIFQKNETQEHTFNDLNTNHEVRVTIKYTYRDQVSFYKDLIIDDLEMRPNRGEKGDTVYFEAPAHNLDSYDVFFLREIDGTIPYALTNMGKNKTFSSNVNGRDILTVKVPDLPVGEYYVVLTNAIDTSKNPMGQITQEKVMGNNNNGPFEYEKFTIIDSNIKAKIINLQPNTGPDTGIKVEIAGQFLGTLNITEYTPNNLGNYPSVEGPSGNRQELVVDFGGGYYNKGKTNEIEITAAKRKITVFIGEQATFLTKNSDAQYDVDFNQDIDRMVIQTPQIGDAATNPIKDVIVETETILTKANGGTMVFKERAELINGFTYIPSKIDPTITSVVPDKIQVVGDTTGYRIPEDRMLAIHGSNFMIHRYIKADGTEVIRYPVIDLGAELTIDKNYNTGDSNAYIKVFDAMGRELDGTEGNEIGTKILVMVPKDHPINNLGKTFIRVTNPVRNSDALGLSTQRIDFIEYVNPDANKNPIINSVVPDVVAVEGGEDIVVEGSNFQTGVMVFIDGKQVDNVTRQGDGKKLTFKAPKGREGETQLQVMNPEGGMDTRPFTYVTTFTNPKITDFAPKKGNTGTLVIIKGENFLKPDPTATADNILRLIGTRVLLNNIEVNDYNRNASTNRIELREYTSPDDNRLFRINNNGKLEVADYYNAVILKAAGNFYTVDKDVKGNITLSDGAANSYRIEVRGGDTIVANKVGDNVYPLTVDTGSITINPPVSNPDFQPITLDFVTPYRIQGNKIVGNRVRVNDRSEIYFTVPILEADGYYDLTVINPDTKKDSKINQQGFYYYTLPESRPVITNIFPKEGSTAGGYTIDIVGSEFLDNAKVYINGVEIPAANTIVTTNGNKITVVVPKYAGDLGKDKDTNRLTVPVVVVNGDGGTASREDGFTYVVPSSNPQITNVVPQKGTAAGGDIIEITGTDFRYFEPYDDTNRNQIRDEDETFNDINKNDIWDDLLDIQRGENESLEDFATRRDTLLGKTPISHRDYDYYYASPILPRVFIGTQQARIVEFSRGYIKAIAPAGTAGRADLYILNNDAGISNKVTFTYESTDPKITSILPAQGSRLGGDRVDIHGSSFSSSEVHVYNDNIDEDGNSLYDIKNQPLVRFGNVNNLSIPREQENSGLINNNRATVRLPGNVTVEYNGVEDKVTVTIRENNINYRKEITGYNDTVKYIPTHLLKNPEGKQYGDDEKNKLTEELIKIEVSDRRFFVDRGYAPEVEYVSSGQLRVNTPFYYTVGKVPTFVINPDGGRGQTQYEYLNPDSRPRIVNITKEEETPTLETIEVEGKRVDAGVLKLSYKGGNIVSVFGEDIREGATIQIGNLATITADRIKREIVENPFGTTPQTLVKLTFEMPNVGEAALEQPQRVIVRNTDGGNAYSDGLIPPIYLVFLRGESAPQIGKIDPNLGPVKGGTKVEIEGNDFRREIVGFEGGTLKVFFGEYRVPQGDIQFIDYKTLSVRAPKSGQYGAVDVKVENPDGELTILRNAFTYISEPRIQNVNPAKIFANDKEGEITLTGSMFMAGAKVVLGGEIKNKNDVKSDMKIMGEGINRVDTDGNNVHVAVVGGIFASSTTVVDDTTIIVKFNETLDLKNNNLIVINPDGGISEANKDFDYQIPLPEKPLVLEAIPGYESTVQLLWSESAPEILNASEKYEIYGKRSSDSNYTFIGDTRDSRFLVRGLQPNTRYDFMVRALNSYGSAVDFAEVTVRTLTLREDDKLKDKEEALEKEAEKLRREGKEETLDGALVKTIGTEEIPQGSGIYTIDFSLSKYKGYDKFVVAIPVSILSTTNRNISITDGRANLTFSLRSLYTREVIEGSRQSLEDAHVRVIFERLKGQEAGGIYTAVSRNQQRASEIYSIDYQLQAGKTITDIRRILQPGSLSINFDARAYPAARANSLFIGQYNPSQHSFTKIMEGNRGNIQDPARFMLLSDRM